MTTRRSFFKRIAAAVVTVALAPELAFGQPMRKLLSPSEYQYSCIIEKVTEETILTSRTWEAMSEPIMIIENFSIDDPQCGTSS